MAKSVVIVDDSKFLAKNIKAFMEQVMGFNVVGVGHNGEEAVELYKTLQPDLITLDITMPIKDGQEALSDILSLYPEARVVMMSAVRGQTITDCIKEGASGFIEKPLKFNEDDFVANTKELLEDVLDI